MSVINAFIEIYKSEIALYEELKNIATKLVESKLRDEGILAITTSRIKDISRLKEKLTVRDKEKSYREIEDIRNDIVDLVGLRIALYFPSDLSKVDSIIRSLFNVVKTKVFQMNSGKTMYIKDGSKVTAQRIIV